MVPNYNQIYIPELNPVIFFEVGLTNLPQFFTKQFEDHPFEDRIYFWQQKSCYVQPWQTTDIIYLQFESNSSQIVVNILDQWGQMVQAFPALVGLPNQFIPGKFSYQVSINLGDLTTAIYFLQLLVGTGDTQGVYMSTKQYVSSVQLENTVLHQYWNSRFHKDVVFETGIQFQFRVLGIFGYLDKVRADVQMRDEVYNPVLLNSRSSKQWPIYYGVPGEGLMSKENFIGLPDDIINIIDEIWGCDNVMVDNKAFSIAQGSKVEYTVVDTSGLYPKRGMKVTVEAGINRNSRTFGLDLDTSKKLVTSIIVDASVFGDTANQNSGDTIPNYNAVVQE